MPLTDVSVYNYINQDVLSASQAQELGELGVVVSGALPVGNIRFY